MFGLSGLSQASQEALRTLTTTVYVKTNVSVFAKFSEPDSKIYQPEKTDALCVCLSLLSLERNPCLVFVCSFMNMEVKFAVDFFKETFADKDKGHTYISKESNM